MSYWLIIDGKRIGPVTLEEVIANPQLTPTTPVWHDGMDDWAEAALLPELEVLFGDSSPLPPPPPVTEPERYRPRDYRRPQEEPAPPMPSTYLLPAILITICCCSPIAIVAIIYASKVSPAYYRGNYAEAERMSNRALIWVIIAFVTALICCPFISVYSLLTNPI